MIEIKIREKYIIGKVAGGPYKPATNQKGKESLGQSLHSSWIKHEPGRTIHAEDKKRQLELPKKIMVVSYTGKVTYRWEVRNV